MKVSIRELIDNRLRGTDFSWNADTREFTGVFEGFWYQTDTCAVYTSDDITDDMLLNDIYQVDNFEEFKEEIQTFLAGTGFNDYNECQNAENYNGTDFAYIKGKGYIYNDLDENGDNEFCYPNSDNTKDCFQCEVITPENSVATCIIQLKNGYDMDTEYEVEEFTIGDDWQDDPGNYCNFGAFVSDKCYYKLWKRYLALTGIHI